MHRLEVTKAPAGDTKYWMPILWAVNILNKARAEGKITSDMTLTVAIEKVNGFRISLGTLLMYDWINLPLVYTQLVSIAVWLVCQCISSFLE